MPPIVKLNEISSCDFIADGWYRIGKEYWGVARLIQSVKDEPVFDLPLCAIPIDKMGWDIQRPLDFIFHMQRVLSADVNIPIILDWNGCIADGFHRVVKALYLGKTSIPAKRIQKYLEPCETKR